MVVSIWLRILLNLGNRKRLSQMQRHMGGYILSQMGAGMQVHSCHVQCTPESHIVEDTWKEKGHSSNETEDRTIKIESCRSLGDLHRYLLQF